MTTKNTPNQVTRLVKLLVQYTIHPCVLKNFRGDNGKSGVEIASSI